MAVPSIADRYLPNCTTESPRRRTREGRFLRGRQPRPAADHDQGNHPRICQIFEVDEEGDILFLVLELLEGRSLENRPKAEATPFDEAVNIAHEILEALQALHGFDIVHRDLKPSNVFLTPHGVKLLDFGLARQLVSSLAGDADDTRTATLLTIPGTILGSTACVPRPAIQSCCARPHKADAGHIRPLSKPAANFFWKELFEDPSLCAPNLPA
jgi:serine/threonine protein kinase